MFSKRSFTVLMAFGAVYLFWGSSYLAIRIGLQSLPPLVLAGSRFLTAGMLLFVFAYFNSSERPRRHHWVTAAITGALMLVVGNGAIVWAEQSISSSIAALLVSTEPLWIVLFDKKGDGSKQARRASWIAVVLGLLGTYVLIWPTSADAKTVSFSNLSNMLLILMASVCWALGSLYGREDRVPRSTALSSAMTMICAGVMLLALASAHREFDGFSFEKVSWQSRAAWMHLVFSCSILAFSAYSWLLQNVGAAKTSTYAYVNPILAVFLGWTIGNEVLTPRVLVAAALIIASVIVVLSGGRLSRRRRNLSDIVPVGE